MKIEHIAIWVFDLEKVKDFHTKFFNASANEKYTNSRGFSSYFLTFDSGCRIELMNISNILEFNGDSGMLRGFNHIAISVGSEEKVLQLTNDIRNGGYEIASEARRTGDGYFESVILDPEGNRIEITI